MVAYNVEWANARPRVCGPQLSKNTHQEALLWPLQVYLQAQIHIELEVFVM
jgi:hypothetical protein